MKFEKKVKQIASVERDVDKVLRAARLQRTPMSNERFETILLFIGTILALAMMIGFFVFLTYMRYMRC